MVAAICGQKRSYNPEKLFETRAHSSVTASETITALVERRARLLVVQRTGDYSFVIEDRMLQETRSKDWLAEKPSVSPVRMKKWLDRAVQEGSPPIGFAMRVC